MDEINAQTQRMNLAIGLTQGEDIAAEAFIGNLDVDTTDAVATSNAMLDCMEGGSTPSSCYQEVLGDGANYADAVNAALAAMETSRHYLKTMFSTSAQI